MRKSLFILLVCVVLFSGCVVLTDTTAESAKPQKQPIYPVGTFRWADQSGHELTIISDGITLSGSYTEQGKTTRGIIKMYAMNGYCYLPDNAGYKIAKAKDGDDTFHGIAELFGASKIVVAQRTGVQAKAVLSQK